ncbi:MAG: hypothetical protein AAGA02_03810 [Bacteroidota bacterium]
MKYESIEIKLVSNTRNKKVYRLQVKSEFVPFSRSWYSKLHSGITPKDGKEKTFFSELSDWINANVTELESLSVEHKEENVFFLGVNLGSQNI